MRMSTFGGLMGGLKDEYLFKNGTVAGHTWSGTKTSYASYTIGTVLNASAQITPGEVEQGVFASLTTTADLTKYKYIHFTVTLRNGSPSITVGGTAVASTTGTKTLDISSMTGNKTIVIHSGTVTKMEPEGNVGSGISVSKVWLSNK